MARAAMTGRLLVQGFVSSGKGGYNPGAIQRFSLVRPGPCSLEFENSRLLIDLNGDGKLDLLNGLQVAYGNDDDTFAAEAPVSFLSSGFETAYAADLNGDAKPLTRLRGSLARCDAGRIPMYQRRRADSFERGGPNSPVPNPLLIEFAYRTE
jgi:hypothetical protein